MGFVQQQGRRFAFVVSFPSSPCWLTSPPPPCLSQPGLIAAYLLLAWDSLVQLAAPCCRRAFAACRRRRGAHGAGASSPAAQPPALPANAA